MSECQIHGTVVIGVTTLIKYNSYCSITSFVSIASITGVSQVLQEYCVDNAHHIYRRLREEKRSKYSPRHVNPRLKSLQYIIAI